MNRRIADRGHRAGASLDGQNRLKEFEQKMTVGAGQGRSEVNAKFDRAKNATTIHAIAPKDVSPVNKTGLVLLRLLTDHGALRITACPDAPSARGALMLWR